MDDRHEELRLALVMNGGVSLAVWMGGVTNEIFRLVKGRHAVYRDLLALTDASARVDVISGTSAGGVNGAALATALQYGGEFSALRDVWLQVGAFGDLLRSPFGDNPGSLLRGDDFFLPHILGALVELAPQPRPVLPPDQQPMDLRLTTTLLAGRQGHRVDDLGTQLHDVDYRAHFLFQRSGEAADDAFAQRDQLLPRLARAARSTASFPFAFEPSYVADASYRLQDAGGEPLPTPRYVIDGGILDNKPFRGALGAIFAMPTSHRVRRVLAYIDPDPGDGPDIAGAPGQEAPAPGLTEVLSSALFGIPMSQTISDQLQEIRTHNEQVRRRRDSVATIARLEAGRGGVTATLAQSLFPLYRRRRLQDTFDVFFLRPLAAAVRRRAGGGGDADPLIGRCGRAQLEAVFVEIDWTGWIPADWPRDSDAAAYAEATWEWGLFPVEFAANLMLALLRRTHALVDFHRPAAAAAGAGAPMAMAGTGAAATGTGTGTGTGYGAAAGAGEGSGAGAARPSAFAHCDWRDDDLPVLPSGAQPGADEAGGAFGACWRDAYACVASLRALRQAEEPMWQRRIDRLVRRIAEQAPLGAAGQAIGTAQFKLLFGFISTPRRRRTCGELAHRMAAVVLRTCDEARRLLAAPPAGGRALGEADRKEIEFARQLVGYLCGADGGPCTATDLLQRIMRMEVIEYAFNDHEDITSDSSIELVQISGDAPSPLCPGPGVARAKLLGLQVAHFGAFYRQSWRANDWTFGRLDGAERLVRILLNPARLRRVHGTDADGVQARLRRLALEDVASVPMREELEALWRANGWEQRLRDELGYLAEPGAQVPDALPCCVAAVTARLHLGILRDELVHVLDAIAADVGQGAEPGAQGRRLQQLLAPHGDCGFTPRQACQALDNRLLGGESLADEGGTDLFTRTAAHAAATTQNLLAGKTAGLGPVSVFFASLKVPFIGFFFVARGLTHQSRTSAALHAGLLVAGLVIVVFKCFGALSPDGSGPHDAVTALGWTLLAYGLLASVLRQPRTVGALLMLLVLLAAAVAAAQPLVLWALVLIGLPLVVAALRPGLEPLQWVGGFALVMVAAALSVATPQSSPALWNWPVPWARWWAEPVIRLAAGICLVIALAVWQTTVAATRLEGWVRRWSMRRRRPR